MVIFTVSQKIPSKIMALGNQRGKHKNLIFAAMKLKKLLKCVKNVFENFDFIVLDSSDTPIAEGLGWELGLGLGLDQKVLGFT